MRMLTGWFMCAVLVCAAGAWGAETPSLEKGQQLFGSEKLGTSGKSCNSCHPGGKDLEISATASDEQLAETINRCIAGPLKGKPLGPESADMKSMVLFLKSLAGAGR